MPSRALSAQACSAAALLPALLNHSLGSRATAPTHDPTHAPSRPSVCYVSLAPRNCSLLAPFIHSPKPDAPPSRRGLCPFHAPTHCTPSMRSSPCRSHFVCRPLLDLIVARRLSCNSSSSSAAGKRGSNTQHIVGVAYCNNCTWLEQLPCSACCCGSLAKVLTLKRMDGCAYNGGSGMASAARRGTQLSRGRLRSEADTTGGTVSDRRAVSRAAPAGSSAAKKLGPA